jgi:hypothetical protein
VLFHPQPKQKQHGSSIPASRDCAKQKVALSLEEGTGLLEADEVDFMD